MQNNQQQKREAQQMHWSAANGVHIVNTTNIVKKNTHTQTHQIHTVYTQQHNLKSTKHYTRTNTQRYTTIR